MCSLRDCEREFLFIIFLFYGAPIWAAVNERTQKIIIIKRTPQAVVSIYFSYTPSDQTWVRIYRTLTRVGILQNENNNNEKKTSAVKGLPASICVKPGTSTDRRVAVNSKTQTKEFVSWSTSPE